MTQAERAVIKAAVYLASHIDHYIEHTMPSERSLYDAVQRLKEDRARKEKRKCKKA